MPQGDSNTVLLFGSQRAATSPQLPADEDVIQSAGQTSINQLEAQSHSCAFQDQRRPRQDTDGWVIQQLWGHSSQPGTYIE